MKEEICLIGGGEIAKGETELACCVFLKLT